MKDVVTEYWLNYKVSTIEFDNDVNKDHVLKSKFAIVTIHDVSPQFSDEIFEIADVLQDLKIPFNFAVIPRFKQKNQNEITNNIEWMNKILKYHQPVGLHGLYHEMSLDEIEDFAHLDPKKDETDIKEAMAIFSKSGLTSDLFIPPTWAINKYTMDLLVKLGFFLVETEQEIILLQKNIRLHANVLNWDRGKVGRGLVERLFMDINKRLYREKIMKNAQMLRIAVHPRDPTGALGQQREMIQGLKDINYNFLNYYDIIKLFG